MPNRLAEEKPAHSGGIVLFVASDILGRGRNRSLGNLLMQKLLHTVAALTAKPETIVLMNDGVKLAAEGSVVLGELKKLESLGVEILACGTCLSRFKLIDKVAVGRISDMYTLADTLFKAEKVVAL
jgi:selenium metabolism protein YedF